MTSQPPDDGSRELSGARDDAAPSSAEEALARSRDLLDRVFHNAPDGILILRWPTVLHTNPAAARLLDVASPIDAVGIDLAQRMMPEDVPAAAQRIRRTSAGERLQGPRPYRCRNPNGREFDLEITSIPIEYEGAPAVLSFARDVTERNDMRRKLALADTHAAMNTLAAGVAHEINNPLGYVLLNLEFLARELRDLSDDPSRIEAMQRRVDDTRHGAERVKAIVRDLQALTRKDEHIRGPVELDQVLEPVVAHARQELQHRARVVTELQSVPCVLGNSTRLEHLFANLLANAAHSLDESRASYNLIRVTLTRSGDDLVVVEIIDNGCGMDSEVLSRAFEPFFTTKPLGVGSGLGLPICKRIVEDLGGRIEVSSQPGLGTSVRVSLRTHNAAPTTSFPPPQEAARRATRRGRILIVDDERAVADSLRFALKDDHEIDTASSGKEARAALDLGTDYDVVLCDLVMPVESGMDLHAYASEQYPAIAARFVFMTGGAFTQRAEKFLHDTTNPRIEKPFELEALRALIDGMVSARD